MQYKRMALVEKFLKAAERCGKKQWRMSDFIKEPYGDADLDDETALSKEEFEEVIYFIRTKNENDMGAW